jgi:hypothetical protein
MPRKVLCFAWLVVAVAVHSAAASAQNSAANALRAWGLLGSWAVRCDMPSTQSNPRYIFVAAADGRAFLEREAGDLGDRNEIVSAAIRADGSLSVTINFTSFNQVRVHVYQKLPGRYRTVYNRGPNNDISVNDGRFRNGQPTPWMYKCR